jgi:hypothetical protein
LPVATKGVVPTGTRGACRGSRAPKPMELVLVLASWIREGEGALASNGFPTGFRPVRLELGPDGEDDRPNGFDGEGPEGTG